MRFVVGLLLVLAAVLKGAHLVIEPAAALANPFGNWPLPVQVGVELGIGLLVLSGLYWQQLRWLTLVLFTAFAAYSLYLALVGTAACGCFGPVKIHPWWTFGLDVTVVLGLLVSIRRNRSSPKSEWYAPVWIHRQTVVTIIVGLSLVSVAILVRHLGSRTATAGDLLVTAGNLVILEPESWVGRSLPIADAIDLDLSKGPWTVLLHRHDCPDCQAAVPRYEALALDQAVALVEVPPYAESEEISQGKALRGRLSNDREWFVQTPIELQLHDGVVLAVTNGHDH